MFNEFDGIKKAREINQLDKSILEILLEVGNDIVTRYSKESYDLTDHESAHAAYLSMSEEVDKEVDRLPSFNENDIVSLVHTLSSVDTQFSEDEQKSLLGMYTGVLVDTLSKRNKEQGKKTIISIEDAHLDYLFSFVQNTNVISIRNSTGDNILDRAACFGGFINYIFLDGININIPSYNLAISIGGTEGGDGSVGIMQIRNSNSTNIACFSTVRELLTIENCSGEDLIMYAEIKKAFLKNVSANGGKYNHHGGIAKAVNCKDKRKYVELFVLQDAAADVIFKDEPDNNSFIDMLFLRNVQIDNIYDDLLCDSGNIIDFVYLSNIINKENSSIEDILFDNTRFKESTSFIRVLMDDKIYCFDISDNLEQYKEKVELLLHQASPEFRTAFCDYSIDKIYNLFNAIPFGVENIAEIESKLQEIDTVYKLIKRIKTDD